MSEIKMKKKHNPWRSKWVWAMFGLFATIFVVNYGFFSVALSTSPGLVTEKYYKYGLQQNKFDKQFRQQAERGWQVHLVVDQDWSVGEDKAVTLMVTDKYSQPVSGGHAEVTAYRPSDAKADITITLQESAQAGTYTSSLSLPIQGVWDMNVLFSKDEEKHMLNQRISIQGDGNAEPSSLEKIVTYILPE